jgi:hypothetical protein
MEDLGIIWPTDLAPGDLVRLPSTEDNEGSLVMVAGKELDLRRQFRTSYVFVPVPSDCAHGEGLTVFRRKVLVEHGWI